MALRTRYFEYESACGMGFDQAGDRDVHENACKDCTRIMNLSGNAPTMREK